MKIDYPYAHLGIYQTRSLLVPMHTVVTMTNIYFLGITNNSDDDNSDNNKLIIHIFF